MLYVKPVPDVDIPFTFVTVHLSVFFFFFSFSYCLPVCGEIKLYIDRLPDGVNPSMLATYNKPQIMLFKYSVVRSTVLVTTRRLSMTLDADSEDNVQQ